MLRKLLKYEILATGRTFLPIYGALLVFALINKVLLFISPNKINAPQVLSMIIYIAILAGMFVMTLVVMIQRFYRNLLSDEGYLMFTLPTKPWKLITSKLLISMLWVAASGIAAILSIYIITFEKTFTASIEIISEATSSFFGFFGISSILVMLELLLICFISLASCVLIIYASIALGHLFSQHRVLASLGAFLVLNTAPQIFITLMAVILGRIVLPWHITIPDNPHFGMLFMHLGIWCFIIFIGVLTAGYFAITNYILDRHLNLE